MRAEDGAERRCVSASATASRPILYYSRAAARGQCREQRAAAGDLSRRPLQCKCRARTVFTGSRPAESDRRCDTVHTSHAARVPRIRFALPCAESHMLKSCRFVDWRCNIINFKSHRHRTSIARFEYRKRNRFVPSPDPPGARRACVCTTCRWSLARWRLLGRVGSS